jgi:hypothetical protein
MGEWTSDQLREAAIDEDGPSNKRAAAKKRLRAESDARLNSGKPVADEPFEQLVNRLEGMPQKAPDIVVNVGPTLCLSAEQVFERIDSYITSASRDPFDVTAARVVESTPAVVPQLTDGEAVSDGRGDGPPDSEGPAS